MSYHHNAIPQYSSLTNFLSESQSSSVPAWTCDESVLLEQQIARTSPEEDGLKAVLSIAPFFPHKSIQQISLRIQWLRSQSKQSWDDFCKSFENEKKQYRSQSSFRHTASEASSENSSTSSHSSNGSSPHITSSPIRQTRTAKSEDFKTQKRKKAQKSSFMAQTSIVTINNVSSQIFLEIDSLISQNFEILERLTSKLQYGFVANKNDILTFTVNLRLLLSLTDKTALPKSLPFLPLVLDIPPELATLPQDVYNSIKNNNLHFM
ncbi:hypothetical protein EIN_425330 [Entamoeba invadens IP1]|uniref:Myb-like domain-containing protein n=1 Tax=Entamoeba invadens IP1 TaxID=370355 RepID=A0A0A1U9G8_ENTIV|nr:hypothetical protein EIN_425330 [Entamoeba invadens IP1]ELP89801.1 hypothetical protein EIN_425330 [Entamoeba invadens IP1]|eukprot:XP_004256572.1 hypothetical protein EIN_425330 [Entamoeba invadens IP1]